MKIEIRAEAKDDIPHITRVITSAFGQSFEAELVCLLRESDAFIPSLSLVAVLDGMVIGHILFTRLQIIGPNDQIFKSLALAPMAVDHEFQRNGVGGLLIRSGLKRVKELGFSSVIVLGHPEYYTRFGFQPAGKWNITAPFAVPDPAFMAIELVENGLEGISGVVKYHDAFNSG